MRAVQVFQKQMVLLSFFLSLLISPFLFLKAHLFFPLNAVVSNLDDREVVMKCLSSGAIDYVSVIFQFGPSSNHTCPFGHLIAHSPVTVHIGKQIQIEYLEYAFYNALLHSPISTLLSPHPPCYPSALQLVKPLRHNELRHIWTRVWWWRKVCGATV